MHPILNVATEAAREAGKIINRASQDVGSLKIQTKDYNDFVSEVDRSAEEAINNNLKRGLSNPWFLWRRKWQNQCGRGKHLDY